MAGDFTTVRTVGGLLPPDLLGRVIAADSALGGLTPSDYHLGGGESPREAANRAWSYLTGVWATFTAAREKLAATDPAVGLTRERWLLLLFRELGYGRLTATPAGGLHVGDRAFPLSHLWGSVPIHLLGWGVELDRRTKGVPGAAERAPHAMVQELLNRSDEHLYAVVSNGRALRLLRDSTSLSGQSYVEFDLEAMFDGEVFSDFVLLFLLLHQSRVEVLEGGGPPSDCWLERWRTTSIESGTRALTLLRDGVQQAIEVLGTGFLRHPANADLRGRLADATLSIEDYHRSLLRLAYRLLFLFVAEDRQALHTPGADPAARARYVDYFGTARLRRLALRRRGTKHADLWLALNVVIDALGREGGRPELALPGIGGLFDHSPVDVVTGHQLANDALLAAVRHLSVVQPKGQPKRTVDYRNLGAEELGSIYESLLELVPRHDGVEQAFTLVSLAGNDRKTSGSYYTPTSLIDLVLDETLDPLLDEAEKAADPEAALLAMRVCDPACGSGHFLVAAARRIAERLATARTGEVDLTPTDVQDALHDVVATCIYGVDLNPLATELAKVSLWLEAMRPGRPLSFLDAHLKVGNSLLGASPALVRDGVPDDAFAPLDGDDKKVAALLKKQNARERAGADSLFGLEQIPVSNAALRNELAVAHLAAAGSLGDVHAARQRYAAYLASPELARQRLEADAWCAAFVQPQQAHSVPITTATVRAAAEGTLTDDAARHVQALAVEYRFFHWYLEFPDVFNVSPATTSAPNGWRGGFTAMVGNPPWERIKLQEQEFFAQRDARVAQAPNAAARKRLIAALTDTQPTLAAQWRAASRQSEATSHLLRKSGRYPLCGVGDVNTYSVFAELFRSTIAHDGRMGIITPTGLATDATTAAFFADTVKHKRLVSFLDFVTGTRIWSGIGHNRFRFAVRSITGGSPAGEVVLAFDNRHPDDLIAAGATFTLAAHEILLLNPNTGTLPIFASRKDAEITLGIYRRHPVLMNDADGTNPWGLRFGTLFHMTNDSGLFRTADELRNEGAVFDGWGWVKESQRWLPLYEAKMLTHYDHRFSTYESLSDGYAGTALPRLTDAQHDEPDKEPLARYWVAATDVDKASDEWWDRDWYLGWRDITNAGNERTFVCSVLPRSAVGNSLALALPAQPTGVVLLQAIWSSYVFDFAARQKSSGSHMNYFTVKQLACPVPAALVGSLPGVSADSCGNWIRLRVLELACTSWSIAAYASDVVPLPAGADPGPPFRWAPQRREQLRAELDAAMFHLYGLARDEVEHVMDSFFVVRKYEMRDHGEFRTKRLILQIYDAMSDAAARGGVYLSPLDPPPGEGPRHPARQES